jgi:hypothetical protein
MSSGMSEMPRAICAGSDIPLMIANGEEAARNALGDVVGGFDRT